MLEGYAGTFPCLSYSSRPAAHGAVLRLWLRIDQDTRYTLAALPALLLQLADQLPQVCDIRQCDRPAVFFTPYP
jgi:hypothetical protein